MLWLAGGAALPLALGTAKPIYLFECSAQKFFQICGTFSWAQAGPSVSPAHSCQIQAVLLLYMAQHSTGLLGHCYKLWVQQLSTRPE